MSSEHLQRAALVATAICGFLSPFAAGPVTAAHAATPASCSYGAGRPRSEAPPTCVAVDVTTDRLPAVGETATVRVRLRSQVAIDRARLSVRLPGTLRLASGCRRPIAPG